jgi:hypothetical protein
MSSPESHDDHAVTTPIDPEVQRALLELLELEEQTRDAE